jgi:hypothetical protein
VNGRTTCHPQKLGCSLRGAPALGFVVPFQRERAAAVRLRDRLDSYLTQCQPELARRLLRLGFRIRVRLAGDVLLDVFGGAGHGSTERLHVFAHPARRIAGAE